MITDNQTEAKVNKSSQHQIENDPIFVACWGSLYNRRKLRRIKTEIIFNTLHPFLT